MSDVFLQCPHCLHCYSVKTLTGVGAGNMVTIVCEVCGTGFDARVPGRMYSGIFRALTIPLIIPGVKRESA